MTLPFENDTNSFIKKLASAQLKKERLKKIFTIVAISLATFLMASANKFLRIYYASVTAYLNTQTQA